MCMLAHHALACLRNGVVASHARRRHGAGKTKIMRVCLHLYVWPPCSRPLRDVTRVDKCYGHVCVRT
eukprot:5677058-Pleurochrysis_carterae.AAC.2